MQLTIREMTTEDANAVMLLSHQLGYPISLQQSLSNIHSIKGNPEHACYVAVQEEKVIGWVHAFKAVRIESDSFIEIGGLVVDAAVRGTGIGQALIDRVKEWCLENNIFTLRLRCNTKRKASHLFYEHIGFREIKEQKIFQIILPE